MKIPVINPVDTGENIKSLMRKRYITVKDLQKVLGFSTPAAIYKWLSGYAMPSLDNLVILARYLDVSIDTILVLDFMEVEE